MSSVSSFLSFSPGQSVNKRRRIFSQFQPGPSRADNESISSLSAFSYSGSSSIIPSDINLDSSSSNEDDDDYSLLHNYEKHIKLPLQGKDYDLFKPKQKQSMYWQIVHCPENLEGTINRWVQDYERDEKDAIVFFIQLFIDLTGLQHYELKKRYAITHLDAVNFMDVVEDMETKVAKVQKDAKCLFNGNTTFVKAFLQILSNFLLKFVNILNETGIFFTNDCYDTLVQFLRAMVNSDVRVIKTTSVVIASKLLTALCNLLKRKYLYNPSWDRNGQERQDNLMALVTFTVEVIIKNCIIPDGELSHMRLISLNELKLSLSINIKDLFTSKLMKFFIVLLSHSDFKIRKMVIDICIIFIREKNGVKFFLYEDTSLNKIRRLIDAMAMRLTVDPNEAVRCSAVNFFTNICKNNRDLGLLPETIKPFILTRIASQHDKLARCCAHFYATMLSTTQNETSLMENIIEFSLVKQFENKTGYLMEALFVEIPSITNIHPLISNLMQSKFCDFAHEKKALEVLYFITRLILTGKARSKRKVEIKRRKDAESELYNQLFRSFDGLFSKYQIDDDCLNWLLKTLNLLDFKEVSLYTHKNNILNIVEILKTYFLGSLKEHNLREICKFLLVLTSQQSILFGHATTTTSLIIDDTITKCRNWDFQTLDELDGETVYLVQQVFIHLHLLLEFFPETAEKFNFQLLVVHWDTLNDIIEDRRKQEIIKESFYCISYYLKYSLDMPNIQEDQLHEYYKQFFESCNKVIQNEEFSNIQLATFGCICEVMTAFKSTGYVTRYFPEIIDSINKIIENCCFKQFERRNAVYLLKYIRMVCLHFIPQENMINILKYADQICYREVFQKWLNQCTPIYIPYLIFSAIMEFNLAHYDELQKSILIFKHIMAMGSNIISLRAVYEYALNQLNKDNVVVLKVYKTQLFKLKENERQYLFDYVERNGIRIEEKIFMDFVAVL